MFRVGRYVVYPVYGAGKVVKKYKPKGSEEKYYKIKFTQRDLTVSIPFSNAEELGLRYPLSKTKLKAALRKISDSKKLKTTDSSKIREKAKELIRSKELKDSIDAFSIVLSYKKHCEESDSSFSPTVERLYKQIIAFLKSEIEVVLGESEAEKFEQKYLE